MIAHPEANADADASADNLPTCKEFPVGCQVHAKKELEHLWNFRGIVCAHLSTYSVIVHRNCGGDSIVSTLAIERSKEDGN